MSNEKDLTPHIQRIASEIFKGNLSVVVGAGVSYLAKNKSDNKQKLPLWEELSSRIAKEFGLSAMQDTDSCPLEVFQYIEDISSRADLESSLRRHLSVENYEFSKVHDVLSQLKFKSIITTNYDSFLSDRFGLNKIVTNQDYDLIRTDSGVEYVFHLHGDLSNPHTLTHSDYSLWESKNPDIAQYLKYTFRHSTVLLIGYSLSDPHVKNILSIIREQTKNRENLFYTLSYDPNPFKANTWSKEYNFKVLPYYKENDLIDILTSIRNHYYEHLETRKKVQETPSLNNLIDSDNYIERCKDLYNWADLHMLYVGGAGYSSRDVKLDEIYVEPDLVTMHGLNIVKSTLTQYDIQNLKSYLTRSNDPNDEINKIRSELDQNKRGTTDGTLISKWIHKIGLAQAIKLGLISDHARTEMRENAFNYLSEQNKLILLGEAGQGKSTLLRSYFKKLLDIWKLSNGHSHFPIYFKLPELELTQNYLLADFQTYLVSVVSSQVALPCNLITKWARKDVVWLLDGFDEIRNEKVKTKLLNDINILCKSKPNDKIIVSSRPAESPVLHLGNDWNRCKIPRLSLEQVTKIINNWNLVLTEKESISIDTPQLLSQLEADPALVFLRGNALLITLIVLFYKTNKRLPNDKWEFYEHAAKSFAESTARQRVIDPDKYLPSFCIHSLLSTIALSGMKSDDTYFNEQSLIKLTTNELKERNYSGESIDKEVNRFLIASKSMLGIFIEKGIDQFGFLHLTFQEYYAARKLLFDSEKANRIIKNFSSQSNWKEVINLYGYAIKEDKARLNSLLSLLMSSNKLYAALELALNLEAYHVKSWSKIETLLAAKIKEREFQYSFSFDYKSIISKTNIKSKVIVDAIFNSIENFSNQAAYLNLLNSSLVQYYVFEKIINLDIKYKYNLSIDIISNFKSKIPTRELESHIECYSKSGCPNLLYYGAILALFQKQKSLYGLSNPLINKCNLSDILSVFSAIQVKNENLLKRNFKLTNDDLQIRSFVEIYTAYRRKESPIKIQHVEIILNHGLIDYRAFKRLKFDALKNINLHNYNQYTTFVFHYVALICYLNSTKPNKSSFISYFHLMPGLDYASHHFLLSKLGLNKDNFKLLEYFPEFKMRVCARDRIIVYINTHNTICRSDKHKEIMLSDLREIKDQERDSINEMYLQFLIATYTDARSDLTLLTELLVTSKEYNVKKICIRKISFEKNIKRKLLEQILLYTPSTEDTQFYAKVISNHHRRKCVKSRIIELGKSDVTQNINVFYACGEKFTSDQEYMDIAISHIAENPSKFGHYFYYLTQNIRMNDILKSIYLDLALNENLHFRYVFIKHIATQDLITCDQITQYLLSSNEKLVITGLYLLVYITNIEPFISILKEKVQLKHSGIKSLIALIFLKDSSTRRYLINEKDNFFDFQKDSYNKCIISYALEIEKHQISNPSLFFFDKLNDLFLSRRTKSIRKEKE